MAQEDTCPLDGRRWDDHTLAEARTCGEQLHDHTMEYEEINGGQAVEQELQVIPVGTVAVRAGTVGSRPVGVYPTLVFDFAGPGGPLPSIALTLDDGHMRDLRRIVGDAIDGALKAARRAR